MSSPAPERRGLGRGLEVLLGGQSETELAKIPLGQIQANPRQPRRKVDAEALSGLAESVRAQGIIQPVVVRPIEGGRYELIAGERRWRAAKAAGLATVPALVRATDDRESLLLALVENVAREDLSAVEEARAYALLQDEFQLSLGDVAERVGRSKPSVSNRIRLLELPEDVLWMLARGELSEGHARAVLALPDDDSRRRLAKKIANDGLTVRAAEKAARDGGARRRRTTQAVDPALAERARVAAQRVTGLPTRVNGGKLEIHYGDETGLAELVEALEALA